MFKWIKNILGIESQKEEDDFSKPLLLTPEQRVYTPEPVVDTLEPIVDTPELIVDLDNMNKKELLAEAKARGIKVNSSLKKAEILDRLKNG